MGTPLPEPQLHTSDGMEALSPRLLRLIRALQRVEKITDESDTGSITIHYDFSRDDGIKIIPAPSIKLKAA